MKRSLQERQSAMKQRNQRPPRGRLTGEAAAARDDEKARFVLELARELAIALLREGKSTVEVACKLRDAFSPRFVNLDKLESWVKAFKIK